MRPAPGVEGLSRRRYGAPRVLCAVAGYARHDDPMRGASALDRPAIAERLPAIDQHRGVARKTLQRLVQLGRVDCDWDLGAHENLSPNARRNWAHAWRGMRRRPRSNPLST